MDNYLDPRYLNLSAFVQDRRRIRGRLRLTYGLRREVNPAPTEAGGNLPLTLTGIEDPPAAKLAQPGTRLSPTNYRNLAPRLGFAWQPLRPRATVVRAAVGVFYDLSYAFTGSAFTPTNYPFSRIRSVTKRLIDDQVYYYTGGPQSYDPPYLRLLDFYDDYNLPASWQYRLTVEQSLGRVNTLATGNVGPAAAPAHVLYLMPERFVAELGAGTAIVTAETLPNFIEQGREMFAAYLNDEHVTAVPAWRERAGGAHRLRAIVREHSGQPETADWESFWASLTFEIPAGR